MFNIPFNIGCIGYDTLKTSVIETKSPPIAARGKCLALNKLLLIEFIYLVQKGIWSLNKKLL